MERMIIYGLVLLNLCIGLLLYYRKPRPFGRRSYEAYLQAEPESPKAAGAGEERVNIPWRFGFFCGENIYKGLRIWYLSKMDGVRASAVPKRQSVTNGRVR